MFDVLSPSENRLITGLVGYGLHHSAQHLYGNLQVVVLGGFLSEYPLRRGDYVKLVLGGLLFPMWITAIIGGASIGASGMAFAYRGFILFLPLLLIHYYMSDQSMQWTTLHTFYLFLTIAASLYLGGVGLLEIVRLVEANSGDLTHALGFIWGMAFLSYLVVTKADMDIGPGPHQSHKT
jgi:hypothetical protein